MKFKLRNRIALFYMTAVAVITGLLFLTIYTVVHNTVYNHLDDQLQFEVDDVKDDIAYTKDSLILVDTSEWGEEEHKAVEVYPIFIEVFDRNSQVIKKTGNLKKENLPVFPSILTDYNFNSQIESKQIWQGQRALINAEGNTVGYIEIALPLEGSYRVIAHLGNILLVSYPIVLLILFLVSRGIAGKSIYPIQIVTKTAEKITNENLSQRIELPPNKDEIFTLTTTINSLLDRLEDAVLREKQFTSDASHELRNPLASIKGTLEVLIRKPRDVEYYESKISYCIKEVNRMSVIIDQLLMLARYESGNIKPVTVEISLKDIINYTVIRMEDYARYYGIKINFDAKEDYVVKADASMLDVILENLISNSIKYSNGSKNVDIKLNREGTHTVCSVIDYGIGMKDEQVARIFDRFYRSEEARNSNVGGHGIGLAIVKRLADVQHLGIEFSSQPQKGTTATITFNN